MWCQSQSMWIFLSLLFELHWRGEWHIWLVVAPKLSIMSYELFQLVTTSVISLCFSWSWSCLSFSWWLANVLRLKNPVTRLILPSSVATVGILSAFCDARLRLCAKQWTWPIPASLAAAAMVAALSVTTIGFLLVNPHSSRAPCSKPAILSPVWLSCVGCVCKTWNASFHSSVAWWAVMVT